MYEVSKLTTEEKEKLAEGELTDEDFLYNPIWHSLLCTFFDLRKTEGYYGKMAFICLLKLGGINEQYTTMIYNKIMRYSRNKGLI